MSYSVIYERLKFYLGKLCLHEGDSPYSFRRACAVTLSLSGSASAEKGIMGHVGWFLNKSLEIYSEMHKLVDVGSVSNLFAQVSKMHDAESIYKICGDIGRLPKAFM